jgi:HlyD family secretion protein
MSGKGKIAIGVVVLVVVLGGLKFASNANAKNRPVEVRLEQVGKRDLVAAVTASGQIEAKKQVDISSEVTARILKIHVKEGDMVREGDLLVELDQVQFKGNVDRSEAQLAQASAANVQARANRDQAKRALDRQKELKRSAPTLVSDEAMETSQNAYDVAEALVKSSDASVEQAKASLKEANDNLKRTKLYSPISGKVVRLAVEEGEVAQTGAFSKDVGLLMKIADLSVIQAKVKVDETDVVRLALNDSVAVTIDAFPDTTFVGRVTKVGNSAAATSSAGQTTDRAVDFEVEVTLTNPPKDVRPDLSMTARIITDVRKGALSIPIIALTARADSALMGDTKPGATLAAPEQAAGKPGDTTSTKKPKEREGVFVVNNGVATFRPVKVGIAGDEYFEVLSGLKEGETIVAGSYQAIRDMKDSTKVKEAPKTAPGAKKP